MDCNQVRKKEVDLKEKIIGASFRIIKLLKKERLFKELPK
jgi:hypothetical protein